MVERNLETTAHPTNPVVFPASGSIILTADFIWLTAGHLLQPGWLHIENGYVTQWGQGRPLNVAPATDLGSLFLTPGLVDAHVHLDLNPGASPHLMDRVRLAAAYGLAGVRDGGDNGGRVLMAKAMVQDCLCLASPGVAMFAPGRYGAFLGRAVDGIEAMGQTVAEMVELGANHVKVLASGPVSLKKFGQVGPPQFSRDDLAYLSQLAKDRGLPLMAHANGPEAVRQSLEAGVDSIEHGYFMGPDNLKKLADTQAAWIPTIQPLASLLAREPRPLQRDILNRTINGQVEQLAMARLRGVRTVLGTDAGAPGLLVGPGLYQEMHWWRQAGYSVEEILTAATARSAELMGRPDLGSLLPGSAAFVVGFHPVFSPGSNRPEPDLEQPPCFVGRPDLSGATKAHCLRPH